MYNNVEAIDMVRNKETKIVFPKDFLFAKGLMDSLVTLSEFFEACKDYPIVFVKNEDIFSSVALLGYKPSENVFVNKKGEWAELKYIPAFIRRYPFILAKQGESFVLAKEAGFESEDGERLFTDSGEQTKFLEEIMKFLNEYHMGAETTSNFVQDLENWGLLELKNATVTRPNGENFNIEGFYAVSEEKLNQLDEDKKIEICKKGAVPFITAHLISLSNLKKLANA
jgi:hypothetical protein